MARHIQTHKHSTSVFSTANTHGSNVVLLVRSGEEYKRRPLNGFSHSHSREPFLLVVFGSLSKSVVVVRTVLPLILVHFSEIIYLCAKCESSFGWQVQLWCGQKCSAAAVEVAWSSKSSPNSHLYSPLSVPSLTEPSLIPVVNRPSVLFYSAEAFLTCLKHY